MFKKLIMAMAVVGITAMPFTALAAQPIQVESTVTVANTNAANQFEKAVTANVNDEVAIQVWYHNREEADSGLVAKNVKVAINLPTAPGVTQTVNSTVSADNANTSTSQATISLPLDRASLQVVAGSGVWRHNIGDNTNVNYVNTPLTATQEQQLLSGGTVVGDQDPCFNFEATVSILVRVIAPVMTLTKQVQVNGSGAQFTTENSANPGDTLRYVLTLKNVSNTTLTNVVVGDNLAPFMTYVNGSTVVVDSNTGAAGKTWTDGLVTGGITVDNLAPGGTELVFYKVNLASNIPCGDHALNNVGVAKANGIPTIQNTALTHVNVACKTTPPPVTPPTTPPTTTTLPQTGAESAFAGMTGTGVLGYTVQAYRKSKRSLANALKNIKR